MRRFVSFAFAISALGFLSIHAQPAPAKPNIVLIITDDVGYSDLGSYGAPDIRTPNIDSLAKNGTKLTHFYANASSCSPTRAGLISGRYQQRFVIEAPFSHEAGVDRDRGLPASPTSLPRLLKNAGYATALIGKWHLGYRPNFSPIAHGFDSFFGFKSGFIDYYRHSDGGGNADLFENDTPTHADGYMTDLITQRATRFIEQHASTPFFLELAYNAAHWPYQDPDRPSVAIDNARHLSAADDNPPTRADYVKIMERADRGVGEILATLDRLKLAPNTFVIFTNDNGGEWLSRNAPLFSRKFSLYEGGIRVPAILRWPGQIPAGVVSTQVGITMDLTATVLAVSGATVPADARLEGINLMPMLRKGGQPVSRTLFWRVDFSGFNQHAVRDGKWKLLIDGALRRPNVADTEHMYLFDLEKDQEERHDLAPANAAVVRKMRQQLAAWEKDVDAEAKARSSASRE